MAVIGKFENGRLLVSERVAGPANYLTGAPPAIVFSDLSVVEEVISLQMDSGHIIQELATVLASVTFRIRGLDAAGMADGDPMLEIPDGQDESGSIITGFAYGR